jgi:hypothetical protein
MKLSQIILAIIIGLCMIACESNEPELTANQTTIEQGKLNAAEVMKFLPYTKGQTIECFNSGFGIAIIYTVQEVTQSRTDSALSILVKMKGMDYDKCDYYNIETSVTCTNKKQIDVTFTYSFKMSESRIDTQIGTYQYIDTENSGAIPQNIVLLNRDNLEVAQLTHKLGINYYLDEMKRLFYFYY